MKQQVVFLVMAAMVIQLAPAQAALAKDPFIGGAHEVLKKDRQTYGDYKKVDGKWRAPVGMAKTLWGGALLTGSIIASLLMAKSIKKDGQMLQMITKDLTEMPSLMSGAHKDEINNIIAQYAKKVSKKSRGIYATWVGMFVGLFFFTRGLTSGISGETFFDKKLAKQDRLLRLAHTVKGQYRDKKDRKELNNKEQEKMALDLHKMRWKAYKRSKIARRIALTNRSYFEHLARAGKHQERGLWEQHLNPFVCFKDYDEQEKYALKYLDSLGFGYPDTKDWQFWLIPFPEKVLKAA